MAIDQSNYDGTRDHDLSSITETDEKSIDPDKEGQLIERRGGQQHQKTRESRGRRHHAIALLKVFGFGMAAREVGDYEFVIKMTFSMVPSYSYVRLVLDENYYLCDRIAKDTRGRRRSAVQR